MQALETSLATDGWIGAITVAADGETFDGSARVEKTAENGMLDDAIVVDSDGTRPIVVRRTDIPTATDERAVRLGIAANRVASLNLEWEPDVLASIADSGVDLSSLFTADEWRDVSMPAAADPEEDAPVTIDETKPTRCQLGDVWRVGRHTVACLDSTVRANVEWLVSGRKVGMVVADPPYGVNFDPTKERGGPFGGVGTGGKVIPSIARPAVIGDATTATARAAAALSLRVFEDAIQVWFGANNYADCLPPSQCWLVWDKENTGDFADVELAWTNQQSAARLFRHMWNGMLKDSERGERRVHATQKPIALFAWLYEKYGDAADIIFDPFLGSGPSLKAAEPLGRTVIGFELSPHYIDYIIEWAEAEGLECERVDE